MNLIVFFNPLQRFDFLTESGTMKLKEAFRAGYGIPHERNTCRTWDGRSPLQKCKFPFRVKVRKMGTAYK